MIDLHRQGGTVRAEPTEALQFDAAPELRRVLMGVLKEKPQHLVLDCARITRVDSSAIAVCLEVLAEAKDARVEFVLENVGAQTCRVIELARLQDVLPVQEGT